MSGCGSQPSVWQKRKLGGEARQRREGVAGGRRREKGIFHHARGGENFSAQTPQDRNPCLAPSLFFFGFLLYLWLLAASFKCRLRPGRCKGKFASILLRWVRPPWELRRGFGVLTVQTERAPARWFFVPQMLVPPSPPIPSPFSLLKFKKQNLGTPKWIHTYKPSSQGRLLIFVPGKP